MRKRMLDPDFWNDADVGSLQIPARLLFIGLISHADDEGRGIADPRQLRKQVFGFDDVPVSEVEKWLSQIIEVIRNVEFYVVDGKEYYALLNWTRYQKISHPSPSSLPPPPSKSGGDAGMQVKVKPNIFTLYESNIGPLTSIISDVLKDAEKTYPYEYIEYAIDECVKKNKRSWSYAETILARVMIEGIGPKPDAKSKADTKSEKNKSAIDKVLGGKSGK